MDKVSYRRHRFPGIVIQQAIVHILCMLGMDYARGQDLGQPPSRAPATGGTYLPSPSPELANRETAVTEAA
jgi:hypothetical protein